MRSIDLLQETRRQVEAATRDLGAEGLRRVPAGFNNNVLWHVGHLVVTQQLLCYKLSGLPMAVDDATVEMFQKGSSPRQWSVDPDYEELVDQLHRLAEKLRLDYDEGVFRQFQTYTTSVGFTLESIEDAIVFNNLHEGIHLGYVLALRRAVVVE